MRCALVTPIDPRLTGNGLAHRARMWQQILSAMGELTTFVVPVAGPITPSTRDNAGRVVVALDHSTTNDDDTPTLATAASQSLGAHTAAAHDPFDLTLCFRSYLAPFTIGMHERHGRRGALVVDLDDDDVAFFAQRGDPIESERFAALIATIDGVADLVVSANGFGSTHEVPNAVAIPDLPIAASGSESGRSSDMILMVANFDYAPNREGAEWFRTEVVESIRLARPQVQIRFVGPGSEAFGPDGLGFVDDLTPLYADAAVAVVPVIDGSGTRIKALEAFAHGVPVVSTPRGVEGLGVRDGAEALIADNPTAFVAALLATLDDRAATEARVTAALHLVATRFEASVVSERAIDLLRGSLHTRRSTASAITPASGVSQLRRAPSIEVTEVDDGLVIFEPIAGVVHHLNPTASMIFTLADTAPTATAIAEIVQSVFSMAEPPLHEVETSIDNLIEKRLLIDAP